MASIFAGFQAEAKKKSKSPAAVTNAESSVIGYVDLNRALNEVNEGKKAKAKLEKDGKAKKQKLEIKQKELRSATEAFEKQRLILSADVLRKKEMELQKQYLEMQKMTVAFEREFAQKEAEFTQPIAEKLKRIIAEIGNKEGFAAILPKEMMLYAPDGTDLTEKVISKYNKAK